MSHINFILIRHSSTMFYTESDVFRFSAIFSHTASKHSDSQLILIPFNGFGREFQCDGSCVHCALRVVGGARTIVTGISSCHTPHFAEHVCGICGITHVPAISKRMIHFSTMEYASLTPAGLESRDADVQGVLRGTAFAWRERAGSPGS